MIRSTLIHKALGALTQSNDPSRKNFKTAATRYYAHSRSQSTTESRKSHARDFGS